MRAVVLAAGVGSRLGVDGHKALVEIAPGRCLLSNLLRILGPRTGLDRVFVVVGHRQAEVRRAAAGCRFVENPRFAETNTARSLQLALGQALDDDVLILNADLFLPEEAIRRLLRTPVDSSRALVMIAGTPDAEVVGFERDSAGALAAIGKGLSQPEGEAVGATLMVRSDVSRLVQALQGLADGDYYEAGLDSAIRAGGLKIRPVDVSDLACREVDFPEDLAAVRRLLAAPALRGNGAPPARPVWRARSVGLYGVGHFGYALLRHLEPRIHTPGREVRLRVFDRDETVRDVLRRTRRHPYYSASSPLDGAIGVVDSAEQLVEGIDTLVLAVTSSATREVVDRVAEARWSGPLVIVNTAKALDAATGRRLSEVVRDRLPTPPFPLQYAALSGGTIAEHLLQHEPLGMTVACTDPSLLAGLKELFSSEQMWVEATSDLVGVEYAGALKNVIAICAGMVAGQGRSLGAETHLISRMASEIESFCVESLGADPRTFSLGSQCWGSDLWMSCAGPTRNRAFGEMLGRGATLAETSAQFALERKTVEGVQTLRAIEPMVRGRPEKLPLLVAAARVILRSEPPESLLETLMRLDAPRS